MADKKSTKLPPPPPTPRHKGDDPQAHAAGGVDFVPTEKEYDPAKHANHSHLNP